MGRTKWFLKQLVPHTVWTVYTGEGLEQRFVIWRMWLGRCYDTIEFPVAPIFHDQRGPDS